MNASELKEIADTANKKVIDFKVSNFKNIILKSAEEGNYFCEFDIVDFFIEDPDFVLFLNSLNGFTITKMKMGTRTKIIISWK